MAHECGSDDMFTRRNPSQRQIKRINPENLVLDDLEDESDDDYVFEGDEDEASDESGSETEDGESSASNSGDRDSDSSIEIVGVTRDAGSVITDPVPDDAIAVPSEAYPMDTSTKKNLLNAVYPQLPPRICMICLGDQSNASDELIECDACKVVVHEECHKVYDNVFLSSSASSSETDPWFCEPCLAGVENPRCELCPNLGGIFKRTDNNRWVHILCALYTRGVKFDYLDSLRDVTLTELSYQQWSSKECSLCQDKFFAWTGVCINCDAGLCKSHFHATCAQREGLISEPLLEDSAVDPYFAHCKQHTEKDVIKARRRNYLSAFNRCQMMRQMTEEKKDPYSIDATEDFTAPSNEVKSKFELLDERLKRKLAYFRDLYNKMLSKREKPYTRPTKVPFYLENSPVAMRMFVTKSMALNLPLLLTGSSALAEASKSLAPGCPIFGPEFVTYVLDREKKIDDFSKNLTNLGKIRKTLQASEADVSRSYSALSTHLSEINVKRDSLRDAARSILKRLAVLLPGLKPSGELAILVTPPKVVIDIQNSSEATVDSIVSTTGVEPPSRGGRIRSSAVNANAAVVAACSIEPRKRSRRAPSGTTPIKRAKRTSTNSDVIIVSEESVNPVIASEDATAAHVENILHQCSICGEQHDQHLLALCDTCKQAFHIACLDPPLTRVPKPSKIFAWQCSACTLAVVTPNETVTVDVNAPRQLRRSTIIVNPSPQASNNLVPHAPKPMKKSTPWRSIPGISSGPPPIAINSSTPPKPRTSANKRRSITSSSSSRRRGGNRGRLGRLRRVEAEAYDVIGQPQEVIPSEAYPVTEVKNAVLFGQQPSSSGFTGPISISSVGYVERPGDENYDIDNGLEKSTANEDSKSKRDRADDDLAAVRGSKVKFVRIKDHESPNQSFVESPPQHYVICSSPQESTPKKSPLSGNFKIKIKKSTNS